jgi:hypothetical protein
MTQYRTYLDDSTQAGQETILGIQQNGSEFGVGVSTDIICNNISAGIITASQINGTFIGISTLSVGYATTAGIATYATTSGISTTSQGLTGTPNITVGIITATNLIVTGISTFGLGTISSPLNSQLSFELTSNTNLRIKVRGTDGVLRSANITLT